MILKRCRQGVSKKLCYSAATMTEIRTGIPETQVQKAQVIDLQAARQKRLPDARQDLTADRQVPGVAKQDTKVANLIETPTQERGLKAEGLALPGGASEVVAAKPDLAIAEAAETSRGLDTVRRELREEQLKGEGITPAVQAAPTETATPLRVGSEPQGRDNGLPSGKMEVTLDKYSTALIDTSEEKDRKREQIPQKEREQLATIIEGFGSRPLSEDEWKTLEGSHNLTAFFDSLDDASHGKMGFKQELVEKGMNDRVGKLIKERATDRYPDWWQVYDNEGNRVFKMSLPDKALLAKWKEFDGLPPDEKMAILKEFADTHIPKDEKESFGEKFAKVIDSLVEFLVALFKSPADPEETLAKKAA
jgi:hypothetical protein